ncbi:MAG: DNA internalization-related competence protein ComEC/Rec2, partial [Burkholderiales bacterium]
PGKGWRGLASGLWGHIVQGLRTQWLATWGLTPLSLVIFQQFSLVGWVANLLAIPVVTLLVTPLAMLGVFWPGLWSAGSWVLGLLMSYLEWLAAWPWAVWVAPAAPWWAQCAGLIAAVIWMAPGPLALRSLAVVLVLPLLAFVPEKPPDGEFDMLALDVGQGTAVLIQTRNHRLLFDTGPWYSPESNAGQRVVIPVLQALGHSNLDLLVLSHRDLDHVGGAQSLLRQVPVANMLSSLEPAHLLHQQAATGHIPSLRCEAGQYWVWDHVRFEVLHPGADDYTRTLKPNAMSCVIKVSAKTGSVMLTGDIERMEERSLLRNHGSELASTVLLVPHHGSKTSSLPEFLASVQPSRAVIQAGYQNHYGHPAASVTRRYQEQGIPLTSTISCGAWRWKSFEVPAWGQCERQLRRRYWHASEGLLSTEEVFEESQGG